MSQARQQFARTLSQDALVAEYDRAMEDRAQLADLHGAAHEAMEQFRAERDALRARVAELEARIELIHEDYMQGTHDAFCAGDCGRLTANGFCRDCMVHGGVNAYDRLELAKGFLAGAVAAEREACRKICADVWTREPEPGTARDCHDAIRSRGSQKGEPS